MRSKSPSMYALQAAMASTEVRSPGVEASTRRRPASAHLPTPIDGRQNHWLASEPVIRRPRSASACASASSAQATAARRLSSSASNLAAHESSSGPSMPGPATSANPA